MPFSLKDKANKDKDFLINQTQEFLKNANNPILVSSRAEVEEAVKAGDFTKALQNLEILREEKTGVKLTKIERKDGAIPVIVRDARKAENQRVLGTEGFEMQYLNATRAAMDIADIEGKPELKEQLKHDVITFIENFHKENSGKSQEEISINVKNKVNDVAVLLEEKGIEKVHKKLNIAKDFQNFNDEHCNIVTLSNVRDKEGKEHTVIEAEVALKGLTEEQKQQYNDRANQKWYTKMPKWEQKLVDNYAETITNGSHVIPTQLKQIVGMKNAFEKITAVINDNSELEIIHNSKHAGTLVSLSRDSGSQQKITNLNAKQAQEWMGEGHIIHANTLNSGNPYVTLIPQKIHPDASMVRLTRVAMDHVGGHHTNTAFNTFRKLAAMNNFDGAKNQLNDLANNLPNEGNFAGIKTHLKPRGKLERLFGINKPKGDFQGLLDIAQKTHNLPPETIKILQQADDLKKNVEKAGSLFYRGADKKNVSLDISRNLNLLSNQVINSNDFIFFNVPRHETLTMCASGKDRTGLAEHDQTISVIANKFGMDAGDVDKQLLKAGHTTNQAGGVYAGGATVGCYGTLKVTAAGFPESRKDALQSIIEPTGANNKIKKLEKGQIINEKKEQEKAEEISNNKTESYATMPENIKELASSKTLPSSFSESDIAKSQKKKVQISKPEGSISNDKFISSTPTPTPINPSKPQSKGASIN